MSAEEIRSEHVMIRLKPAEKALLEAKAKERGLKPTQLAYESVMGALETTYTPKEVAEMLDQHGEEFERMDELIDEMRRMLSHVEQYVPPRR